MSEKALRLVAAGLEQLRQESIAAERFEEAVIYDNALHQLERRLARETQRPSASHP